MELLNKNKQSCKYVVDINGNVINQIASSCLSILYFKVVIVRLEQTFDKTYPIVIYDLVAQYKCIAVCKGKKRVW